MVDIAARRQQPHLVTVIIPGRNAATTLERQLECLARQDYSSAWEVIISDNGSTDRTAELARKWADRLPCLRVVDASARPGASHARNVAAAAAHGDLLAFSDADDEVDPHWLTALTQASQYYDVVGGLVDESTLNGAPSAGRRTPTVMVDRLPVVLDFLPYAVGTNCGIWADVLDAIGGWNENYPRANDVELSWRAQSNGYTIGFAPCAIVHYRHRASVQACFSQFHGWGRADPQLFRDFRAAGLKRRSLGLSLRDWAWLVKHLPDVLSAGTARSAWLIQAARLTGRLRGSIQRRVLYL